MTYAVRQERISRQQARIERHSDQSAPHTQLVLTIPAGGVPRRIDRIAGAYSATVTQTITIVVVSGISSAFDETLLPIVINADEQGSYVPATDIWLSGDDSLVITAPAEGVAGTLQVETATINETAPGTLVAGNMSVTVTSAGMTGSGVPINVAVATNDTEAQVAAKVTTALTNNANVGGKFTVTNPGGAPTTVVLTAKVVAADDATLNVATADGTSIGIASTASSVDTLAGVAAGTETSTLVARLEEAGM